MSASFFSSRTFSSRKIPQGVLDTVNQLLFDAGQVGGNLSFTDFSKIWQDSAGTTPYTAVEQYVGKIIDKSPNALAFTQATSAARPVVSARVNLLTKTEQFDYTNTWFPDASGTTVSGKKITETATTGLHVLQQNIAVSAGVGYTLSIRAKAAERSWLFIYEDSGGNSYTFFNLATGAVGTASNSTATIVDVGNGYYGCKISFTQIGTTSRAKFGIAPGNLVFSYAGDGVSGILVDCASLTRATDAHRPYQSVNTPTDYNTAGFSHYLKFDSIDNYIVSAAGGGGTAGIYYCGAIRFNKSGAVQTIFSDAGTNSGYKLQLTAANQLQISAGNGTAFTAINTTDTFSVGDVALCELWDDGTNLGVRLGEGTPVTVARPVVTAGTAQITIGKDNNAASNYVGISMFEPVWRYGAMPNTTQREAIRAICRAKAGIV